MFVPNFTHPQQFFDSWNQMAKDQLDRMLDLGEQMAKLQGQGVERAHTVIDESAKLMKASLDASVQLSNEWRKLGVEMTKKATAS
jgi:hypothetical protein